MKKWQFGMYRRLSFDERSDDESNSVVNQKKMIDDYLKDKTDIKIVKSYVDDGYTGTDFNRPNFQKMLEDIEKGKINGVIVKDLSRIGRNYIAVGSFIEDIMPKYGVRLICINDHVDSINNSNIMDSLEIPFKNLLNESYSKDASQKMRTSLIASKRSGNFIGVNAPYGYLKDPDDYHKLIIDKEAAEVVKHIFNRILEGKSKMEIADELNRKHIPTPSIYLKKMLNVYVANTSEKWSYSNVDKIIRNKVYKGTLEQNKRTRISHKIHNVVVVPEKDRIIFDNAHKPIIKPEVFELVHEITFNRNVKVDKNGKLKKYNGYLKCSECGTNLYRELNKKNNKERYYYYCGLYRTKKQCNKHFIYEDEIDEAVITCINNYFKLIDDLKNKLSNIVNFSEIEYNETINDIRKQELDIEIGKCKKKINEVINDYGKGFISQRDYENFKSSYVYDLNQLNIEKEKLNNSNEENNLSWLKNFKDTNEINEVDRSIVINFIDEIIVGNNKDIEVVLKFKNKYYQAIDYLKRHNL